MQYIEQNYFCLLLHSTLQFAVNHDSHAVYWTGHDRGPKQQNIAVAFAQWLRLLPSTKVTQYTASNTRGQSAQVLGMVELPTAWRPLIGNMARLMSHPVLHAPERLTQSEAPTQGPKNWQPNTGDSS